MNDSAISHENKMQTSFNFLKRKNKSYLFGPVADFLLLGGGASIIALPLVLLFLPEIPYKPRVLIITYALTNLINHPHFAHSYQIFYKNFRQKISATPAAKTLRMRYIFSGIVVLFIIVTYYLYAYFTVNLRLLGLSVNFMFLFVGWHYAKQGYGMAIVDSVLKKAYYSAKEKRLLLINTYISWFCIWLLGNGSIRTHSKDYFGIHYFMFELPRPLLLPTISGLAASTLMVIWLFGKKILRDKKRSPFNGMSGYIASIYLWLIVASAAPVYAIIVPAFHSLQYSIVVWRYHLNWSEAHIKNNQILNSSKNKLSLCVPRPVIYYYSLL